MAYVTDQPVVTTSEARAALSKITEGFDHGDPRPVVFGSHRRAQAVILPWQVWQRVAEKVEDEIDLLLAEQRIQAAGNQRIPHAEVLKMIGDLPTLANKV